MSGLCCDSDAVNAWRGSAQLERLLNVLQRAQRERGRAIGETRLCIAQPNNVQRNFGQLAAGASIDAIFALTQDASAIGLREIAFALSGNVPDVTMANNAGSLNADVRPVAIFDGAFDD